ncbi:MAG TPA: hypothetical protein VGH28_12115 [Polyangiaceae bacterium]|jgi:beta-mannosidase
MARLERNVVAELDTGWELAESAPGAVDHPRALDVRWKPARRTTVASALGVGLDDTPNLDAREFWFRRTLAQNEIGDVLRFGGLATIADVWIDDEHVLRSDDMFLEHAVDVAGRVHEGSVIYVRFASLAKALEARRPRPRWRATIVAQQQLRFFRTSLMGRIPAWMPPIAPVGFWRPVTIERNAPLEITHAGVRARVDGTDGVVEAVLRLRGDVRTVDLVVGETRARLTVDGSIASGLTRVPNAPLWWPHTHGTPALLPVSVVLHGDDGDVTVPLGATGFRTIDVDTTGGAFTVHVNGVRTFCRGACWMPLDPISLAATPAALRRALVQARDAGMNMIRISGTTVYESDDFYALCDELGILVWQDFMFANMDYPFSDERFGHAARAEAEQVLDRLQLSPSLAIACGGSEVEQQAAMMGLPEKDWSSPLFQDVLPSLVTTARPDVAYVPSSPTGGSLPFDVDTGVSHYYGVGAYMRPLEDARRARVRFTSECLAFANLPCDATIEALLASGEAAGADPRWKSRVARDRGTAWDFDDVRDHYVKRFFDVDPDALRRAEPARWLELGRVATGEAMAAAMSEWRRAGSECAGAIVWFLRDLWEGAGWGVVDSRGVPKSSYYYLKRVLAPVALLAIDEGLNGLVFHAVNDRPAPLACELRVALHRGENIVARGARPIEVAPHDALAVRANEVLGRFTDLTYAYRFGPPGHDVTVATLVDASGAVLGRAFHYPRGLAGDRAADLGVEASAERIEDGVFGLAVRAKKIARGVAIDAHGFVADDDFFDVAPGETWSTLVRGPGSKLEGTVRPFNAIAPTRIVNHAH